MKVRTIVTSPFYVCGFLLGATVAILEYSLSGVLKPMGRGLERGFDTFEVELTPGETPDES